MTLNNILDYESEYKVCLTFKKIDIDFYNNFVKLCKNKKYSPNTTGTRIKSIKRFLSAAEDAGIDVCQDYKKRAFQKIKEETESVYLTTDEL